MPHCFHPLVCALLAFLLIVGMPFILISVTSVCGAVGRLEAAAGIGSIYRNLAAGCLSAPPSLFRHLG
jgi:hypothetical protein